MFYLLCLQLLRYILHNKLVNACYQNTELKLMDSSIGTLPRQIKVWARLIQSWHMWFGTFGKFFREVATSNINMLLQLYASA